MIAASKKKITSIVFPQVWNLENCEKLVVLHLKAVGVCWAVKVRKAQLYKSPYFSNSASAI